MLPISNFPLSALTVCGHEVQVCLRSAFSQTSFSWLASCDFIQHFQFTCSLIHFHTFGWHRPVCSGGWILNTVIMKINLYVCPLWTHKNKSFPVTLVIDGEQKTHTLFSAANSQRPASYWEICECWQPSEREHWVCVNCAHLLSLLLTYNDIST